ncbi:MAG: hypothetical protein AB7G47_08440 [Mycolicibacterium sp.]|uniref:hypothetical protein n=1 Tax=Mycolicibacterium sp. TaxID=2320850 RepID=UPI003D0DE3A4
MRQTWKTLLILGCLLSFVALLGVFNASKPRILVLHSLGQDSLWVAEVDRGMREALDANRRPVSVEWMYMDVGASTVRDRVGQAQADARRAMDRVDPDVLIAVDDEANLLVARDYIDRRSPRILYLSLDRPPADYGYVGASNVSGIAEQLPFAAVRDAAITLFEGRAATASVVGVDGVTGQAEMAQVRDFDWGPLTVTATELASTAVGWRDFVTGTRSDVLIVLSCRDLPEEDGGVFTAADAIRWTQDNSRALPIGTQVDFVRDGGVLSFSPPPDDYGKRAIELALDWLDDRTTPGPPPPLESPHFQVALRQGALAARGFSLPPIYVEAAREVNALFP